MTSVLEQLPAGDDLAQRIRRINQLLTERKREMDELFAARRAAINEFQTSHSSKSQSEIARELNMNRGLVNQLMLPNPSPERSFFGWGTGSVTVIVGVKRESYEGGVIEDSDIWPRLEALLGSLSLTVGVETISPVNVVNINLNRKNLIVASGPRLSSVIATMLQSDPYIRFQQDEESGTWYLEDQQSNKRYFSPKDGGTRSDYAYLGRLPRPDRKGFFLCIAGIHSTGTRGAVHFLENNLKEVHEKVGRRRFSVLIKCDYDQAGTIVHSEQVTPFRQ